MSTASQSDHDRDHASVMMLTSRSPFGKVKLSSKANMPEKMKQRD
jgi:hypothetical protein